MFTSGIFSFIAHVLSVGYSHSLTMLHQLNFPINWPCLTRGIFPFIHHVLPVGYSHSSSQLQHSPVILKAMDHLYFRSNICKCQQDLIDLLLSFISSRYYSWIFATLRLMGMGTWRCSRGWRVIICDTPPHGNGNMALFQGLACLYLRHCASWEWEHGVMPEAGVWLLFYFRHSLGRFYFFLRRMSANNSLKALPVLHEKVSLTYRGIPIINESIYYSNFISLKFQLTFQGINWVK